MSSLRSQTISRRNVLAGLGVMGMAAGALALGISPPSASAAESTAGLTSSFEAWFDVRDQPGVPFEIVQRVVDFPEGARAARHLNGGPAYLTMLAGEVTMWIGDAPARAYGTGESFVEPFGSVAEAANLGPTQATLLVTYLIAIGSAVSMLDGTAMLLEGQRPPGPMVRFESRLRIDQELPSAQIGHELRTYPPGAWTESVEPPTARLLTVLSGEVAVGTGAAQQTHTPGQHWSESPGRPSPSRNPGSVPAVAAITTVRPSRQAASAASGTKVPLLSIQSPMERARDGAMLVVRRGAA
jgi:quercetin dioxygenase-like cupin family protein